MATKCLKDPDGLCGAVAERCPWSDPQCEYDLPRCGNLYLTRARDEELMIGMVGLTAVEIASRLGHTEAVQAIREISMPGRLAATRIQAAWWMRKGRRICHALSGAIEARTGLPPPDDVVLQVVCKLLPVRFSDSLAL